MNKKWLRLWFWYKRCCRGEISEWKIRKICFSVTKNVKKRVGIREARFVWRKILSAFHVVWWKLSAAANRKWKSCLHSSLSRSISLIDNTAKCTRETKQKQTMKMICQVTIIISRTWRKCQQGLKLRTKDVSGNSIWLVVSVETDSEPQTFSGNVQL